MLLPLCLGASVCQELLPPEVGPHIQQILNTIAKPLLRILSQLSHEILSPVARNGPTKEPEGCKRCDFHTVCESYDWRCYKLQFSEPEIWWESLFLRNFRDFPGNFGLWKILLGLEDGHSICHQSIPWLGAGRLKVMNWKSHFQGMWVCDSDSINIISRPSVSILEGFCNSSFWQRAENGGLDPSWLISAFLGRPDVQSRGPQNTYFNGFWGTSGLKIGAPQKRENQPRRIQPPILGPLILVSENSDHGLSFGCFWSKPIFGKGRRRSKSPAQERIVWDFVHDIVRMFPKELQILLCAPRLRHPTSWLIKVCHFEWYLGNSKSFWDSKM